MQFRIRVALLLGRISAMQQALRRSSLVPAGFVVESAFCDNETTVITVRSSQSFSLCLSCGTVSRRVHSHYLRRVRDLSLSGRRNLTSCWALKRASAQKSRSGGMKLTQRHIAHRDQLRSLVKGPMWNGRLIKPSATQSFRSSGIERIAQAGALRPPKRGREFAEMRQPKNAT
jgi:hypothetical protein